MIALPSDLSLCVRLWVAMGLCAGGVRDQMVDSLGVGPLLVTCGSRPKVWEEVLSKQRKEEGAGLTLSPVSGFLSCRLRSAISFPPSLPDPWAPGQLSSLSLVPGDCAVPAPLLWTLFSWRASLGAHYCPCQESRP